MARNDGVLAIILGGGQGARLFPLTALRSKPAVPFAGKYRIIDIPVSNCINSDITRMYILTQFNSESLNRHIHRTYSFSLFQDGFIDILAAQKTLESSEWFQGTADAVRQSWRHFERWGARVHLILAGDHLYRMDYRNFIQHHKDTGADVTISVVPCTEEEAPGLGLLKVDASGRIIEFKEKPRGEELLSMRVDTRLLGLDEEAAERHPYLASMGIYVFDPHVLHDMLFSDPSNVDFGREVIPCAIGCCRVQAFRFEGYWQDIGTIRSFYEANMEMTSEMPRFDLYDPVAPIYTRPRFLPSAKVRDCRIHSSLVADGSILDGSQIEQSIVGLRSIVSSGVRIERSILMGADYYDFSVDGENAARRDRVGIGEGSVIRNAIVDKNAHIGRRVKIVNEQGHVHHDGDRYYVRDGIVIIPKHASIPDGTVI